MDKWSLKDGRILCRNGDEQMCPWGINQDGVVDRTCNDNCPHFALVDPTETAPPRAVLTCSGIEVYRDLEVR